MRLFITTVLLLASHVVAGELDTVLKDVAPDTAKWASVVRVQGKPDALQFERFEYGDSRHSVAFWPASVVKVYAVVAALEQINQLGMEMDSTLTFEHKAESGWVVDCARTMREMISEIFRRSSNEDYTLLLRLVGIDRINTQFLIPERGFDHSALMRGYIKGRPYEYVRTEPQRITVRNRAGVVKVVEHTWSGRSYSKERGATVISSETGNCSSTHEMAECLRRIMFHEQLPKNQRYHLTDEQVRFVRQGDEGLFGLENKEAGPYAWEGAIDSVFPKARYFHKAGMISTHTLDLAYIEDAETGARFILAVAAETGDPATVRAMSKRIAEWINADSQ